MAADLTRSLIPLHFRPRLEGRGGSVEEGTQRVFYEGGGQGRALSFAPGVRDFDLSLILMRRLFEDTRVICGVQNNTSRLDLKNNQFCSVVAGPRNAGHDFQILFILVARRRHKVTCVWFLDVGYIPVCFAGPKLRLRK